MAQEKIHGGQVCGKIITKVTDIVRGSNGKVITNACLITGDHNTILVPNDCFVFHASQFANVWVPMRISAYLTI